MSPHQRKLEYQALYRERNKERCNQLVREWRKNNPEKVKDLNERRRVKRNAKAKVRHAIKTGKLIRQPCEKCGDVNSEAHHHKGYAKRNVLVVQWLCRMHHMLEHRKYKDENSKTREQISTSTDMGSGEEISLQIECVYPQSNPILNSCDSSLLNADAV